MQEQERIANEQAEKRLKAALTAKREPATSVSRVASPSIGNGGTPDPVTDYKPSVEEMSAADDISMDAEASTAPTPPAPEVSLLTYRSCGLWFTKVCIYLRALGYLSSQPCLTTSRKSHLGMHMRLLGESYACHTSACPT